MSRSPYYSSVQKLPWIGLLIFVLWLPTAVMADQLATIRTVVLDPGHGGSNEGAVGVAGIYERFITLDTAQALQERLTTQFPDLRVILTRTEDVDVGLSERTHLANVRDADVFISIHYNSTVNPEAHGLEVFYLASEEPYPPVPLADEDTVEGPATGTVESILLDLERDRLHQQSAALAAALHQPLVEHTGAFDRGVRQAQFRVLRGALMPAVVVEIGFLSHPEEGLRVLESSYTERIVDALIEGLVAYDREIEAP